MTNYFVNDVVYYPGYGQEQVNQNLLTKTIASISQSNPMIVTTSFSNFYVAGMMVTFLIPPIFGMQELNRITAQVLDVTTDTITVNVNSMGFSSFSYPSPLPNAYTPPSIIPVSSGPYLNSPPPLPYGNQPSFEGIIFNNGSLGDPVDGGI